MADHGAPGGGARPGVPRWVKVIGLVVAALVALVLLAQLTGVAGDHGPGRHLLAGRCSVGAAAGPDGSGW